MADQIRDRLRKIHLCCAAGVVAAVAGVAALGIWPMVRSGRASEVQADVYRAQLKEIEGLTLKTTEVQNEIATIRAQIAKDENRLPRRHQIVQFMQELASVAEKSGVSLEAQDRGEIENAGDHLVLPATLTVTGSFAQCYDFLAGLRKMERLTRLEKAVLEAEQATGEGSKPGEKGNCRLKVSIATFMAK